MVMVYKATPQAVLRGIRDESERQLPAETTELPQHLPVYFLLSQKSEEINIVGGDAARIIYGQDTFDPMSNFYNHQTVGAVTAFSNANQAMIVPIKMPTATKATIRLAAEVVATTVDGVNKTRVIWHADTIDETGLNPFMKADINEAYRAGNVSSQVSTAKLGALVDVDDVEYFTPSAYIPIADFEVEARGSFGNSFALSIEAPTLRSASPTDTAIINSYKTFVYRLTLLKKNSVGSNPSVVYNKYSENSSDFVLKPDFINRLTNVNMSVGEVITEQYQEIDDPERPPTYGPFSNVAIYQDNIEMLSRILGMDYTVDAISDTGATKQFEIKGIYNTEPEMQENIYAVNIFTGEDINGLAYPNVDFANSRRFGGIRFGRDSVIYAAGGTDGFPMLLGAVDKLALLEKFDLAVRDWCDNFNDVNPIFDSARYPYSKLWDTGFSIETKKSLMKPTGQHKRIACTVATHAVADHASPIDGTGWMYRPALTGAEEVAVGMLLRSFGLLIPESIEFGTPTVRIAICGRSAFMVDKQYRGRLPLTIELIDKVSNYFGSGDGILNPDKAFDVYPNNRVSIMKDVNITYQSKNVYNASWDAGIMWVQNDDVKSQFFPAFRTIYPNDTSVLTSYITMLCACYIERVCEETWRKLTGNGKLTDDEFIEESDRLINEALNGKFDNRFKIVPRTYYTSTDAILGNRWSTDIEFYANNMKTVGLYTVISRRMSDYLATP